jgi:hypothetical protein
MCSIRHVVNFDTLYLKRRFISIMYILGFYGQAFFKAHPEFAKNDFFVTGESYAGHYVPAVTGRLHQAQKKKEGLPINLKVRIPMCFLGLKVERVRCFCNIR